MNRNTTSSIPASTRVVIVGCGFGGAYCARRLRRLLRPEAASITAIDRHNYFVFYPLLIEAGIGSIEPRHVVVSIRAFLRGIDFMMAEVIGIDAQQRLVRFRLPGSEIQLSLPYDYLVLSLGAVTRMPPVPGLVEHGFELKSMADAVALRDRGIELLERANATQDSEDRRTLLRVVVIGGNFTGAELAGEFATFLRQAARQYHTIRPEDIHVVLVEISDRILNMLDEDMSDRAARHMRACGVDVRLRESVRLVEGDRVELASGEVFGTRTVVCCAGIAPPPLLDRLPFPRDDRGYIVTDRDLRVRGFDRVWAIGDCAANPGPDGRRYPATAQHAVGEAEHAATDIARVLRGLPTRPCNIRSRGSVAAIGCRRGVARVFGIRISGFPAWWLYRTIYLLKMPGLARRLRIALDWTMALLFPRDHVQLGLSQPRKRGDNAGGDKSALESDMATAKDKA